MAYFAMLLTRQGLRAGAFERRPFRDSQQGRDLVMCPVDAGGRRLRVGTAHLESYVPGNPNSGERQAQLSHALATLEGREEERGGGGAILAGDLNWNERTDGAMVLGPAWRDSWREACGDAAGFTYDCRANPMLGGNLRLRLDRILLCPGAGTSVTSARMVGREPIPGASREFERRKGPRAPAAMCSRQLLPSDHFGLVADLCLGECPAGRPSSGSKLGRAAPPGSGVEIIDLDSP
jgi:tyrosyl-DNA phosphodiesterase 2